MENYCLQGIINCMHTAQAGAFFDGQRRMWVEGYSVDRGRLCLSCDLLCHAVDPEDVKWAFGWQN